MSASSSFPGSVPTASTSLGVPTRLKSATRTPEPTARAIRIPTEGDTFRSRSAASATVTLNVTAPIITETSQLGEPSSSHWTAISIHSRANRLAIHLFGGGRATMATTSPRTGALAARLLSSKSGTHTVAAVTPSVSRRATTASGSFARSFFAIRCASTYRNGRPGNRTTSDTKWAVGGSTPGSYSFRSSASAHVRTDRSCSSAISATSWNVGPSTMT